MIRRIQALNYRCVRFVDLPLGERQVLVGPNGTGKSTLIDILAFLRDFVRHGPLAAVEERADEFRDLVWGRPVDAPGFELAVEFALPAECRDELPAERGYRTYRYEVALRGGRGGVGIHAERGILAPLPRAAEGVQPFLFPDLPEPPATILTPARPGAHTVLSKSPGGKDRFYKEQDPAKGWVTEVALGPHRSTLGGLPESPETLPASTAIKRILETCVTRLRPDAAAMKRPSPPGLPDDALLEDASNLPGWCGDSMTATGRISPPGSRPCAAPSPASRTSALHGGLRTGTATSCFATATASTPRPGSSPTAPCASSLSPCLPSFLPVSGSSWSKNRNAACTPARSAPSTPR